MQFFPSFSRRIGKSLSTTQKQLISELLPQLLIHLPEDENALLPIPEQPLWLEIGFGGGEHLATQAARNLGVQFIGCEPYINGVGQLLKSIESLGLKNIQLWQEDARHLIARLPDESLARVFILFPDPWPKKRHHRRRIISDSTLDLLAKKLKEGAELRVATDHVEYAEWIFAHLSKHPSFEALKHYPAELSQPPVDWVKTRYQEKAEALGIPANFFCYRKVAAD